MVDPKEGLTDFKEMTTGMKDHQNSLYKKESTTHTYFETTDNMSSKTMINQLKQETAWNRPQYVLHTMIQSL